MGRLILLAPQNARERVKCALRPTGSVRSPPHTARYRVLCSQGTETAGTFLIQIQLTTRSAASQAAQIIVWQTREKTGR